MSHAFVTRAHRVLAYELICWNTALDDLEPWLETGAERGIPQEGIDAAQLLADFEAHSRHMAWQEGYEAGREDNSYASYATPPLTPNPYPELPLPKVTL